MFKKILVANRGEIALRVIRACRELGVRTVAIYSEADARSLHVQAADERVCVGPAESASSYLNIPNILSAAEITNAEAIHPGYGFLAENPQFAEACGAAGIVFIGPTPETIALMGDKARARRTVMQRGLPVIPGSEGCVEEREVLEVARKVGFPVILKASAGGGGRGMRVVLREEDLVASFQSAQAEAKAAFGDDSVYVEKFFPDSRHIEIQIVADARGRTLWLGERDCSIQRRHQKLIEESPSPSLDESVRREMGRVAVEVARSVGYLSAGTVEFLLDKHQNFYFIEMNTRIQVEHPVTEMVTGIDLVKLQIRIASGEPLALRQPDIRVRGHSIECRINAECPERFTPCPGTITRLHLPGGPGVRVDTTAYTGCVIPPQYDSLIAKLIVYGDDREEAIARMRRALDEIVVEGVKTTIPLHRKILEDSAFIKGKFSTNFLEKFFSDNAT